MFTQQSVRDVTLSRKINKVLFSPSDRDMVRITDRRLFTNIPISRKDIAAANKIFGPDLNALKGETVSQKLLK